RGLEALRAGRHDGVVAFGGGSALDAGKVIAFMAGQTRPMWDFEDIGDWWTRADPEGILPVIAVPTTAGTGSEVGRAGVITQEATHTKKVIFHPLMMPELVICDPELTVGLPPHLSAGSAGRTQAGAGWEAGRAGGTTQETARPKAVTFHPLMRPKSVFCEPVLTVGGPPHITAGTGRDALAHSIEAYCAPGYHPMAA